MHPSHSAALATRSANFARARQYLRLPNRLPANRTGAVGWAKPPAPRPTSARSRRVAAPNTPAAVLKGVEVWVPDWNTVLAELDADVAAYQKVTGS